MGKNHKHKKKLRAEKSKTQLRNAAKQLLEGQNKTETKFKIKQIAVMPQLKLITRDMNIHDVIKRLDQHNESLQLKACNDLEYLLRQNAIHNVQFYLKYICKYMQEDKPKARRKGLKLIENMLSRVLEENVSSCTLKLLLDNLRCAMTSINKSIKKDSVLFYDVLLKYLPNLVVKQISQFLPDFKMLISTTKHQMEFSSRWKSAAIKRLQQLQDAVKMIERNEEEKWKKIEDLHERHPFYVIRACHDYRMMIYNHRDMEYVDFNLC